MKFIMALNSFQNILFILLFFWYETNVNCVNENNWTSKLHWESNFRGIMPSLPNAILNSNNEQCVQDSVLYLNHLKNYTTWAFEMWDATGRTTLGQVGGNIYNIGDFEECLKIKSPFPIQYCLIDIVMDFKITHESKNIYSLEYDVNDFLLNNIYHKQDKTRFRRDMVTKGLCIPGTCTSEDLKYSINDFLEKESKFQNLDIKYTASITPQYCHSTKSQNFSPADIAFCCIIGFFIILVIFGSIIYKRNNIKTEKGDLTMRYLKHLSLETNYTNLWTQSESASKLQPLHGLKFFCISSIVMDHIVGTAIAGLIYNVPIIEFYYRQLGSSFFLRGDLLVDTFFLLSGLLVTYVLLEQFQKKIINPLFVILVRYIRLTPLFALLIFYYVTVMDKTGSGPLWNVIIGSERDACVKSWWAALLYINNYVNDKEMCMVHSWYLACDMHYFIIAVFIVILIHKKPRLGLIAICLAICASLTICFTITYIYRKPAILMFNPEFLRKTREHEVFRTVYSKSHMRASSYFCGMLLGYFLFKWRKTEYKLSQFSAYLYFILSILIMGGSMLAGYIFYIPDFPYNPLTSALYSAFHRLVWCIGTSIFILTLAYGEIAIVKPILCSKSLTACGKLTYGLYLLHMPIAMRNVANQKFPLAFTREQMIYNTIAFLCVSMFASLLGYLIIEAPLKGLSKELLTSFIKQNKIDPMDEIKYPARENKIEETYKTVL